MTDRVKIWESPLIRVEVLRRDRVLIVCRTRTRVEDVGAIVSDYRAASEAAVEDHAGWPMILDVRDAPGRNDKDFENAVGAIRAAMDDRFGRIVVLVATAAGALQASRFARERGWPDLMASDEAEAIRICHAG